ncbi:MAG: putative selenate reductase subunit YgfK [Treponema sp.]|jgi:putative selenate reductase|nr:putative selenate reductase subunit YgfK [Treponema sp.]
MSEIMRPIQFSELINWARGEYKNHGSVFGIRKEKFFRPVSGGVELFGKKISSPVGPAAGPGSQLAQNILSAYLAGARFIELKTVQTMDGEELRKAIPRPCIKAADEGYNVEWSTELTVSGAMEEYIKALFLISLFAVEFGIAEAGDVIFNMSVGYSLEGIKSEKIDSYIEGMKNAENTEIWKQCYDHIAANISSFDHFTKADLDAIAPNVSNSITLSTLHGCPRDEIERIAAYLIDEKELHTYVKCNPTLLGFKTARNLLDMMGYGYISFGEHHFNEDLQFSDAVKMLRSLKTKAAKANFDFGVKLTNTFPVEIKRNELPGSEMYMSGRALLPLSLHTAKELSDAFRGELPVSYSGGADFFNLKTILETGIRPVTVATNILKPGGYERFTQLAEISHGIAYNGRGINEKALNALCESINEQKRYRKEFRYAGLRKTTSALPLFDCAKAPCMDGGCPIHQKIPNYLAAVAETDYEEAFRIIAVDNTAPSITGSICDHQCQNMCTRVDYEDSLQIRTAKLIASDNAQEKYTAALAAVQVKTEESAAVIGAGPAGIAAAVFLRRNGVPVTVYEKLKFPFGAVQAVIPSFRISDEAIARDYQMALKTGVEFVFNVPEEYSIAELRRKHRFTVIATGAWNESSPIVKQQEKIIDALRFLEDSKKSNCSMELGKKVAVIGGGDVAMDCARAAKRNRGVETVTVVYRRTREFMPAQHEEQELALNDKVVFKEQLSPETWKNGVLTCEVMSPGDYDHSGRRSFEGTGKKIELNFDTVISAVGARIDTQHFIRNQILLKDNLPVTNENLESSVSDVYIGGDCRKGPATVVKAIADGKTIAADILRKLNLKADFLSPPSPANPDPDLYMKKGVISEIKNDNAECYRCLSCNNLCEICADVCPNRANVSVAVPVSGRQQARQILHIDRMCNECGNCAVFCPHSGKPYRDKLTVFCCEEDFLDSENAGFLKTGTNNYKIRLEDKSVVEYRKGGKNIPQEWIVFLETVSAKYEYILTQEVRVS